MLINILSVLAVFEVSHKLIFESHTYRTKIYF